MTSSSQLSFFGRSLHLSISFRFVPCILLVASSALMKAQEPQPATLDLAVTYIEGRSLKANTSQNFWTQGGSIELGANVGNGWGIAANITGTHAGSIGASGLPLSQVTTTFGPRYRWHADRRLSLYGEGLIGEVNGFRSIFPTSGGSQPDANGLATQVGGGVDYKLSGRFAIRVFDAAWLRTQLPNSTDNVQNNLCLSAGAVLRFAH
jgi:Outer membrane protein beta-barrel domain